MMLNILYQLLKRVVDSMHILQWLKTIIGAKFKGACVNAGTTKSLQTANETIFLDQYFYTVPFYPTLKIFKEYNKMIQWNKRLN